MDNGDKTIRPYDLLLPSVIPALAGYEMNVYFDNLIAGDAYRYDFDVRTSIGCHCNERWTCVADRPGDYALIIEVYSEEGELLTTGETIVRVKATDAFSGAGRRVLFIGDSTTAEGHYTAELLRLFAADPGGIMLLGTKGEGLNRHEGRGGWRVADYFGIPESPFLFDGKFDFMRYMERSGYDSVDDVCIHLGINDVFHASEEDGMSALLRKAMPQLETMIEEFRRFNPDVRIGIMIAIPPSRTQDSFGKSYGTRQSRRQYKRKWYLWNRELLSRFSNHKGIELIPLHINLDTARNMPVELIEGNARNMRTEIRQCNGVHPAPEGYRQMADVLYAWLKP
ncbi:SGNH/GDSL hydrolase family protein [Paenibacillus mesophilus]|uniref:SGNH/GDSL hydrolase family protein n=1 Tax=Paenibacillus mesophilus TaxID=2582849 RepID=UPI00110F17CC|nr:SGNH/GDSL hydrolase family protein [Paenibacillus mesophilus]TMV48639.1 SGNH/GDSL hydrolase family protein [Paenibacillus mesophilus]